MMPNGSGQEILALDRRRYPHIWSWSPLPKLSAERSMHSLAVELLGLLVEWSALLDHCETLDLQFLRAFWTAAIQGDFLPRRLFFLLTILPVLLCTRSVFFNPVLVLSSLPKKA